MSDFESKEYCALIERGIMVYLVYFGRNDFKEITIQDIQNIPNIPIIQIILFCLLLERSIEELEEASGIKEVTIRKTLNRPERNTGLIPDGLVAEKGRKGKAQTYQITLAGLKQLIAFVEDLQRQKDFVAKRNETHDDLRSKLLALEEFLKQENIRKKIVEREDKDVTIRYEELARFDPDLCRVFDSDPEEFFKMVAIAMENIQAGDEHEPFELRFVGFPNSYEKSVADLRSKDVGTLVRVRGNVLKLTDVRPKTSCAKFECPRCGTLTNIVQEREEELRSPARCGCGGKGKFRLTAMENFDFQRFWLEELTEDLEGRNQLRQIEVNLKRGLTSNENQRLLESGNALVVTGVLEYVPLKTRQGKEKNEHRLRLMAHSMESEEESKHLDLSVEQRVKIEEIAARDDPLKVVASSFSPHIVERDFEKQCVVLSIVSGGNPDAIKFRDDAHALLVGEAGTGKSDLIEEGYDIVLGSRYISSLNSTAAGLTATISIDKASGDVFVEKGALPMAHGSVCFCDEFDKMKDDTKNALHEPLENQFIKMDKFNKHSTFKTDCTFIATANPENDKFDKHESYYSQIGLRSTLLDRFDFIIPFEALFDKRSENVADSILGIGEVSKFDLDKSLLRSYLYYARNEIRPKLSRQAGEYLKKHWHGMKIAFLDSSFPFGARQLHALRRITLAHAKVRLSNVAELRDAEAATKLYVEMLKRLGHDIERYETMIAQEESV